MTQSDVFNIIKELPLFSTASPPLLEKAVNAKGAQMLTLASGEAPPPQSDGMLGVLLEGKMHILSADTHNPVVLRSIGKGHVFGAASLFLEGNAPVSRLVAQSACTLFYLDRDTVRELLRADPAFMDAYLRFLAERVHFLNGKIRAFTAGSAERRLALWLVEHANIGTVHVASLSVLADTLDIGRASLYRALDKMVAEHLIVRNGREITLPSPEELLQKYRS